MSELNTSTEGDIGGVILDYTQMTPAPIIKYDSATNAIVFNNPIVPANGFAAQDVEHNLEFASPVVFDQSISLGNQTSFVPMPIPTHPTDLNIPALQSTGTIQTTDILVAKDGIMSFYVDSSGTHVYGAVSYTHLTLPTIYSV